MGEDRTVKDGARSDRRRVLLAAVLAAPLVLGAILLARDPLLSTTGQVLDAGCKPNPAHSRLPDDAVSTAGHWQREPQYPVARDEIRAGALGDQIVVGGGLRYSDGALRSLDEVFRFDPQSGTYTRLPRLPMKADHAVFVGYRGAFYLFGGFEGTRAVGSAWRFSPQTGRWAALQPMRVPRGSAAAAVIDGRVFVVGGSESGRDEPRSSAVVEIYDLRTGTWSRGPDMPTARHHHGAAAVGGKLVVVGGRTDADLSVDAVERLDPAHGTWERLAPLPLGVGGLAVVSAAGMVVAIGGGDDREHWVTPATWGFDPADGSWHRLADLNVARHGHGAAAVGEMVYVFGGSPCAGYGLSDAVESLPLKGTDG